MSFSRIILAASLSSLSITAANAATVSANFSNLIDVMDSAVGGDTIVMSGQFDLIYMKDYAFTSTVFIDATNATFNRTWNITNVDNISVTGGNFLFKPEDANYVRAVLVYDGNNVSFDGGFYSSEGLLGGIGFTDSTNVNISNATFSTMKNSIGFNRVTGGTIFNNMTVGATVDGIDIAASHDVLASHNTCMQSVPSEGAHPDCIQIWSTVGEPISSNIELSDNLAMGDTQGFTKFGTGGPGTNIRILRNVVQTTYPQGIACYDCSDSNISDNLLITLAASDHRVSVNVVGGTNNIVENNVLENLGRVLPYRPGADTIWHNAGVMPWTLPTVGVSDVPEPSTWLSLTVGFGVLGGAMRRKRQVRVTA